MSEYRETIRRGRDNEIALALEQGDKVIDGRGITRVQISFEQDDTQVFKLDSNSQPAAFDFTQTAIVRGVKVGILVLKLGVVSSSNVPDGLYQADVYLFDASNPDGEYWQTIEMIFEGGDA